MRDLTVKLDKAYSLGLSGDDYRGLDIMAFDIEVEDNLVEHRFNELIDQVSREPIGDDPLQLGDVVDVSYSGHVLSDEVSEKDCTFELGFGEYLEPLEASLVGRKVGDSYALNFVMPDVHLIPAWQGASAEVTVTVNAAKRKRAVDIDDAFIAEISDFGSVDELKSAIREQYEFEVAQESARLLRVQVAEKLGGLAKERLGEDRLLEYAKSKLSYSSADMKDEQRKSNALDEAAFEIGWMNVAISEGFSVSSNEVERALKELKKMYGTGGRSERSLKEEAKNGILCEMTVDFLIEVADMGAKGRGMGEQ